MRKIISRRLCPIVPFVALSMIMISCTKDIIETPKKSDLPQRVALVSDYNELKTFLAWCIQLPQDKIQYDSKSEEFFVPNTFVREKLETVRIQLNQAQVYREYLDKK